MDILSASPTPNQRPARFASDRPYTGVDSLPHEIMCNIFMKSLPGTEDMRYGGLGKASIKTPLRISHVCLRWRNVSFSFGELWSHLCLGMEGFVRSERRARMLDIFNTWLERTNGSALNFCIRVDFSSYNPDQEAIRDAEYILAAFTSRQRQWRDVYFSWICSELSPEFPGINLVEMPTLTSLSLRLDFMEDDEVSSCVRVNISHSPGLRRLRLFDHFDLEAGGKQIHASIEECKLRLPGDVPASRRCLHFLKTVPNLKRFAARFNRASSNTPSHVNERCDVVLQDLSYLKLGGEEVFAFVLDNLTLSGLKYLRLHCYKSHQDPVAWGNGLTGLIQRSMPPLTYLDISEFSVDEDTLIHLFHLLPALKSADLPGIDVSSQLFQTLAVCQDAGTGRPADGRVLCPELHYLCFRQLRFLGNVDMCADALIEMLQSRCFILKTFRKVSGSSSIHCDISSIQERRDDLRQRAEHGMFIASGEEKYLRFPDM